VRYERHRERGTRGAKVALASLRVSARVSGLARALGIVARKRARWPLRAPACGLRCAYVCLFNKPLTMDRPAVYPADDMHQAMRVLELGLRNVRVSWNKSDSNRAYEASFQRLQSRLLVLREQAASARWSPAFLQLLRQARSVNVFGLTPTHLATLANIDADIDTPTPNHETWESVECCACVTKKTLDKPPANAIEIVGTVWKRSCRDDQDFLLTNKIENLNTHLMHRFRMDESSGNRMSINNTPLMPGSYLGLFVLGPTCHVMAVTFVWLQNFLCNLAHLIEGHLDMMTEAETKLPVNDFSVVTEEMAQRVVAQLEAVETLLRERALTRPPPPLSFLPKPNGTFHPVEEDMWERIHDNVWDVAMHDVVSPCGSGEEKAHESYKRGWRPTEPSWYPKSTVEKWCLDAYFLSLYRRKGFHYGRATLTDCAKTAGGHAAPAEAEEEDSEIVILEDDDVDVIEEANEDETEEEEDERTQRRKRRAEARSKKKKPDTQRRKKRRAVVEDDDEEGDVAMPEHVRQMRFVDVADASKTVVHLVPGRNHVCILEYT
jgi:hypothetical protein